jgi:predicted RNase H-like nuclease
VRALGVDAAGRFGWVGIVIDDHGYAGAHLAPTLTEVVAAADAAAPTRDPIRSVGVDIPIGLIDGPKRTADVAARSFVGERRSSVFWAPHRSALGFTTQAEANAHLATLAMPLLSAQAMGLMGRIREAAPVAAADERVIETFPEASFRQMAGAGLPHAKRSAAGALHRLALLRAADPPIELPVDLGAAGSVPIDDAFDAAACAWSARRAALGVALVLGDPAERDPVTGRRIAMWV